MSDYIVVGAGSAGSVIASRLSEDENLTVTLIEAGMPTDPSLTGQPALSTGLMFKTQWDWDFDSEPEPGLDDRRTYLPRGRGLGGTTALNGMAYIRGPRLDFDEWSDLGFAGWGFDDVLPYFLRAEGDVAGLPAGARHLEIDDGAWYYPISDAWVDAAASRGTPRTSDFNEDEDHDRVGRYRYFQSAGRRSTASEAYLTFESPRPNLNVITSALVTRIVFDGNRAIGVEIERFGAREVLTAEREVIVSAGAYNSPQLLMLSGIGPADELARHGIDVRADLPVGENLQDHFAAMLGFATDEQTTYSSDAPEFQDRWALDHGGPLAGSVNQAGGFFRTRSDLPASDIQTMVCAGTFLEGGLAAASGDAFVIVVCGMRAFSRGRVTLRSSVPSAKVRILHNHLTDPRDRRCLIDGLRLNMEIIEREPIASLLGSPSQFPESSSDDDLDNFITRYAQGLYHPTSSCSMGAVVDAKLKVIGFTGLRVVDASVMPFTPRGNINAAITAVAEKAADLIRGRAPLRAMEDVS